MCEEGTAAGGDFSEFSEPDRQALRCSGLVLFWVCAFITVGVLYGISPVICPPVPTGSVVTVTFNPFLGLALP